MIKSLLLSIFILFLALLNASELDTTPELNLTQKEKKWLEENPVVKIAFMSYWESDDHGNNIHINLINLLNKYSNLNIMPINFNTWEDGYKEAKSGKNIHGIANINHSKQREDYFLFTKAYSFTPHHIVVKDNNTDIKSLEDLKDMSVYIKEKTVTYNLLRDTSKSINIVSLKTDDELYKKLSLSDKVNAAVLYSADREKLKKYNLKIVSTAYDKYSSTHIGIAHKHYTLHSIINKAYHAIPQNKLTALQNTIYQKTGKRAIRLSLKEQKWLKENPNISFTGNPNWLPFEAYSDDDGHEGIVADYLTELEKLLPLKFDHTLELAKNGKVDIISNTINLQNISEYYSPIASYLTTPIVIVTRKGYGFINHLDDISDKKITLIKNHNYIKDIQSKYKKHKFEYTDNSAQALEQLMVGKTDAVLLPMPEANYLIRSKGYSGLKIAGKVSVDMKLTLFVLNSKPELYSILNRTMGSFLPSQHSNIVKEWQEIEFAETINYTLLFQIAGLLGFFLLGTLYWNRKLSREIDERLKVELELLEAKKDAESANLAKSEFLANMSHEIRTPMNSIIGFSELLSNQITNPIQKDYLDSIQKGGSTLMRIINDILDLSKIEAGKLDIVLESVNIQQLALEMESIFSVKLIQKNINFELEIDSSLPKYLLLDNIRIRQILFNLIGNAIKFTSHGLILLSIKKKFEDVEKSKIDLEISVKDSGIGIPRENLEHIFNAFEQQKGQNALKYGGTGLGLAISKKLAKMMNGTIAVKSEIDKGSIFTLSLLDIPISSVESDLEQNKIVFDNVRFKKATILVVDDIKDNRKLVSSILLEHNLDSVEAENGKDAIELLKNIKIDLIFMDIKMPIMSGYEATKIIKSNEKTKNIPLIALTASVMGKDMDKIKEYKFDGYLRKPISQKELLAQMGKFLTFDTFEADEKNQEDIGANAYVNLPTVLKKLETQHSKEWSRIKDMGDFTLISNFGEALKQLGSKNDIALLVSYADELKANCDSFDVDKIDFMMNSFPPLIEKLKGIKIE